MNLPSRSCIALLFGLLCACGRAPLGAAGARGHGGRGVLLIAVDSLRADHMGFAGYDRDTTPKLDSLIAEGAAFSQTFTPSPAIIPAHAALLTACDPLIVRQPLPRGDSAESLSKRWRIPSAAPSLAVEFLAAGYATSCFVDHAFIRPALGFKRGFERFDLFVASPVSDDADFGASRLGRRVLDWIRSLDSDRDWFAYVHINDLERDLRHPEKRWNTFFQPRPELDQIPPVVDANRAFFGIPRRLWPSGNQTLGEYEASYDGHLRRLDNKLGRLFALLDAGGRMDNTTLCVVGTYGVGFGEAGLFLDHGTLADVDLHVPWVLKFPQSLNIPRGQISPSLASLVDVGPTLLEIAGIRLPSGLHGRSQLAALRDPKAPAVREFSYSMGGLSDGFAVHDERFSFQFTTHAVRGDKQLVRSWYGGPRPDEKRVRRHLRDRESGSGPGDLEPSDSSLEPAERLRLAGIEWYDWMEQARLALHAPPWLVGTQSPELLAELRERGLIPLDYRPWPAGN